MNLMIWEIWQERNRCIYKARELHATAIVEITLTRRIAGRKLTLATSESILAGNLSLLLVVPAPGV